MQRNRTEFGRNIALQILFLFLMMLLCEWPATQRAEFTRLGAEAVSIMGCSCSLTGSPTLDEPLLPRTLRYQWYYQFSKSWGNLVCKESCWWQTLGETLEGRIGSATLFWNMGKPTVLRNAEAVLWHS